MRYLVYGVLVAISFIAGWQVEKWERMSRTDIRAGGHVDFYDWNIESGTGSKRFDIQVCDEQGDWKTLAFGAGQSGAIMNSGVMIPIGYISKLSRDLVWEFRNGGVPFKRNR